MKFLVLVATLSVCFLGFVKGAVNFSPGDCPAPYQPGDSWSEGQCDQCTCYDDGYQCASCGVISLDYDESECYVEYDYSQDYPACCMPVLVCRGDDDFDESKLSN